MQNLDIDISMRFPILILQLNFIQYSHHEHYLTFFRKLIFGGIYWKSFLALKMESLIVILVYLSDWYGVGDGISL